mgnify:CR=1 FL=1
MSFESFIHPDEHVIGDHNYRTYADNDPVIDGQKMSRGLLERDYDERPLGSGCAAKFDLPTIPRDEWRERTKSRLSDLCDVAGLQCKNQGNTNYCWINAPTYCMEVVRAVQNQELVLLSAASVGCRINEFRNQGGWGTWAIEYLSRYGIVPESIWPANSLRREHDTEQAWEKAKRYRMTEWWDLTPRSFDELMTCLVLRIPVAIGLTWWRHEVTAIDPVYKNGFAVRIRNSWGLSWGDKGYSILTEAKATPDDALAPRTAIAA